MDNSVRTLQLGPNNWSEIYPVHENAVYFYEPDFEECEIRLFDIVLIDRNITDEEYKIIYKRSKAYTVFVSDAVKADDKIKKIIEHKVGEIIKAKDIPTFLAHDIKYFFADPYGEKMQPGTFGIEQGFSGKVAWDGYCKLSIDGVYGNRFRQTIFVRRNIEISPLQCLEFWLEYSHDSGVELELYITKFSEINYFDVQKEWVFSEKEMEDDIYIENDESKGFLFISIRAKGEGVINIKALHFRYSRCGYGKFLPGGKILRTTNREEIFSYFDPMDLKPPLCVYFSGYKTQEGFEGYYMMRKMRAPFLLIGEARLEGGCGYMGDDEYERCLIYTIEKYRKKLGFSSDEVILSGLSMGTIGAMYYSCDIKPGAVIVGKPLLNWGDVAKNGKIYRPNEFATAFDILKYLVGNTDEEAIKTLNQRFWNKFSKVNMGKTTFAVSYMIEDDYDSKAYGDLISHLQDEGVVVYGKGMHGRHNDNSSGVINWFTGQYNRILKSKYGR